VNAALRTGEERGIYAASGNEILAARKKAGSVGEENFLLEFCRANS